MPESRFARLSASPHDKSRRRTSGGFHPLPFRLTSGEANHPPQTGRRKTKCRAGADPTQHNKRQHRLGTHNAPQGCFSSALFSPLSREFPSMPPPLGGTGKRTCQLTGGLRPSVAVSSTGESYTYFPRKMEKGRLVCSRGKARNPLAYGVKKRYNHLAVRPGGRCVGALFTWTGFRELPLPETAAFFVFRVYCNNICRK